MREHWTKYNHVMMIISMIVSLIIVFAIGNEAADSYSYRDFALPILLGGTLSVLAFHAIWGLIIEIPFNIIELSYKKNNINNENFVNVGEIKDNSSGCNSCGNINSNQSDFCQVCGAQRIENSDNFEQNKQFKSEIAEKLSQIWSNHKQNGK